MTHYADSSFLVSCYLLDAFATGPGFTDELFFSGEGPARHLGDSTANGYSRLRASTSGCFAIVHVVEGTFDLTWLGTISN